MKFAYISLLLLTICVAIGAFLYARATGYWPAYVSTGWLLGIAYYSIRTTLSK